MICVFVISRTLFKKFRVLKVLTEFELAGLRLTIIIFVATSRSFKIQVRFYSDKEYNLMLN